MIKYEDNVSARINGNNLQPLLGASVTVTSQDTGLLASLYAEDGITPIANPQITDDNGYFGFRAPDGKYTLTFSGVRFATFTREIVLEDPDDNPYATKAELAAGTGSALVTFTQAGAGAVSRDMQSKARDTISIKDFSAKGDSVTDDTAAIQAALYAANAIAQGRPAYGITVHFPAGTYKTTSTITIPAYVNLLGETVEGVIINALFNGDAFQDDTTGGSSYLYFTRIEEISIYKSQTDGTGNTTGKAVNFRHNASMCRFRRLRIYGGEYAIYGENLGYSMWNNFDGCFFDKQTVANVYLGQGSNATKFYGCQFHGAPVGLDAPGASVGITLTACDFESYTTCAIRTDNANITVLGGYNEFKNALESIIIINGTGTVDIIGAYVKGAGAGYLATLNGNGFARYRNCMLYDFSYGPPATGTYAANVEFSGNSIGGTTQANAKGTEKGVFTPEISFSVPGDLAVTYATQVGRFSKVGNRVTLDVQIVTSTFTWTTAAGYLRITGIPYPGSATTGAQSKGDMSFSGITKAGYTQFSPSIDATNRQQLIVMASGSGVTLATVNAADLPSGSNKTINLSITYETEW